MEYIYPCIEDGNSYIELHLEERLIRYYENLSKSATPEERLYYRSVIAIVNDMLSELYFIDKISPVLKKINKK